MAREERDVPALDRNPHPRESGVQKVVLVYARIAPGLELGCRGAIASYVLDTGRRVRVRKALLKAVVGEPILPRHVRRVLLRENRERRGRGKLPSVVLR